MGLAASVSHSLVVSIVSHGHGAQVQALLHDMARLCAGSVDRVVLTLNVPEPEPAAPAQGWPFALQLRRNAAPLGFGANHNRALAGAHETLVCVLNPDVRLLQAEPFAALAQAALAPGVGCAYPLQVNAQGTVQCSERQWPTWAQLWHRRILGQREARVDWVNAACLVLPGAVWRELGGFDEAYFMYCEDVDMCARLRLGGWALARAPARLVHAGQRASSRSLRHLAWHVRSLLRLWGSAAFRQALRLPSAGAAAGAGGERP